MSEPIIFYGAGKNAELNLEKWHDRGIIPVCIVDMDERKQHMKFMGYDILPLEEAIARHPGYVVYITLINKNLLSATNYLIERGVPKDRIRYFDDVEYRKGCWQMEGHIHITPEITPCTHWCFGKENGIPLSGQWEKDFQDYVSFIEIQRMKLRKGVTCVCGRCPELADGLWPVKFTPRLLALSDDIKDERCNCHCVYCDITRTSGNARGGKFTILDIFYGLEQFFPKGTQVYYAPAELTISPHKKEIYAFMKERGWFFSVVKTNGILYNQELTSFLNTKTPTRINVSLDSGTRETYIAVKGVDSFFNVVKNLQRYKDAGARIELKYVIIDELNDNISDIDAFADVAKSLDAQTIVTVDLNTLQTGVSDKVFDTIKYFIGKMKSLGLPIRLHSEHYRIEDYARIKELLC